MPNTPEFLSGELIDAGRLFHQRGWVPATGGNFSARAPNQRLVITASGTHKGELRESDFLSCDLAGRPEEAGRKTSYETPLHTQLYRRDPAIGCVLHTHSVANTLLSMARRSIELQGYELLKVLPGIRSHDVQVSIPVFANDQDVERLAALVDSHMQRQPIPGAYLIAGHGLYAWGDNVAQARWRVEALEFLFECELSRANSREQIAASPTSR